MSARNSDSCHEEAAWEGQEDDAEKARDGDHWECSAKPQHLADEELTGVVMLVRSLLSRAQILGIMKGASMRVFLAPWTALAAMSLKNESFFLGKHKCSVFKTVPMRTAPVLKFIFIFIKFGI